MTQTIVVTGAGGFIGHHLCKHLVPLGYHVIGVDLKKPEFEPTAAHDFYTLDLRNPQDAKLALVGANEVYMLAADMGGIGYIESHKAEIVRNNTLINLNTLDAARAVGVQRVFFASSACVYPAYLQNTTDGAPLREYDAYPADPEDGYGWEKLTTERLCRHYQEAYGIEARMARFHNIYGPLGTYDGGKEKSPAAICRKIALAEDGGTIEVWGDGEQTRSYCYVDDCVAGIHALMRSNTSDPVNIGSSELVTINQLVQTVARIAGKRVMARHDLSKPIGVRGRSSDNTLCRKVLGGWEPKTRLEDGLKPTYHWIEQQLVQSGRMAEYA